MPKVKTVSGAKKRIKISGSGKLRRKHAYKNHILTKKSKKRKKRLVKTATVRSEDVQNFRNLLKI